MIDHQVILEIELADRRRSDLAEAERDRLAAGATAAHTTAHPGKPAAALRALLGWFPAGRATAQ